MDSSLRTAIFNLLVQYGRTGLTSARPAQMLPLVELDRITRTLERMRSSYQAHSVDQPAPLPKVWFSGQDLSNPDEPMLSMTDHKSIERARELDRRAPLRMYASNLHGGRCASVWMYAQRLREVA
jgi:hypothetical protein